MPMQKVLWTSKLKSIPPGLDAKKLAEAIRKAAFDKALEVARANQKERETYTANLKSAMKEKVDFLTQAMERSSGVTDDKELARLVQGAKQVVQQMATIHSTLNDRNEEYGKCFDGDGFRMDLWVGMKNDKEIFKNTTLPELQKQLSAPIRERSDIMGADMANNAEYTRIVELEKRGKVLLSEIEANAVTGLQSFKKAIMAKSDFKAEATALIDDAWKKEDDGYAKFLIKNLEIKLNNIQQTVDEDNLPTAVRVDRLILNLGDAEKLRKGLSGVVKTLELRRDSLVRKYGEHDWNADLLQRVETAVKLPKDRLVTLTEQVKKWVPIGVEKVKELRELLGK